MKFLFLVNDVMSPGSGIGKKIISQCDAVKPLVNEFYFASTDNSFEFRNVNGVKLFEGDLLLRRWLFRYCFSSLFDFVKLKSIDVVYIRYTHFSSPSFIVFTQKLKSIGVKIIIEVPTYPYDYEYKKLGLTSNLKLLIDKFYRKRLSKYIDKCVTFTAVEDDIFGIDTLQISNAVSADNVKSNIVAIEQSTTLTLKVINFVCVASLHSWHGYDRLILSLSSYTKLSRYTPIHVYIVGDGPELNSLKKLVATLQLNSFVTFCGELQGDDLRKQILLANIGIDSLGRHRVGNESNNSLKSKEYLSFGLPVVKSHKDYSLETLDCVYDVSADEQNFDIEKIILWYKINDFMTKKIEIANICLEKYTWETQMKTVLKSLKC
ncbi:glycosyltransferase [Shewanella sp. 10N.286.52.A9]|uniref:glycosyltransferase n=1 Tax=Shewanella sp. 10N.286.52.A9 TaxID=3229711 RepID=UPI003550ED93